MGNPPGGFQIGDACHTCIPDLFEFGRTPAYLAVKFSGIQKYNDDFPDPPNGIRFILRETAFCYWFVFLTIAEVNYQVWVYLDDGHFHTEIKCTRLRFPFKYVFEYTDNPRCQIAVNSTLPDMGDPERDVYGEGSATVKWGSAINESAFWEQDIVGVP